MYSSMNIFFKFWTNLLPMLKVMKASSSFQPYRLLTVQSKLSYTEV